MRVSFSSIRFRLAGAVAILAAGLMFSACNKNHNDDMSNIPAAGLMAFNLAPDVSSVGVALSGNNLGSSLNYGTYTGGYLGVYVGNRPVESYNAASGARLATETFTFQDSSYYSLFVVGANNTYKNVIVKDDFAALGNASGKAFVRYINAVPDSSHPTVTIAAGGTNVVSEPATFATVSAFKEVAPGDVSITVNNGGSINANRTITLEANKVYTVLLSGVPGSTGPDALQIKFITNGTLDQAAGRASSASARSAN